MCFFWRRVYGIFCIFLVSTSMSGANEKGETESMSFVPPIEIIDRMIRNLPSLQIRVGWEGEVNRTEREDDADENDFRHSPFAIARWITYPFNKSELAVQIDAGLYLSRHDDFESRDVDSGFATATLYWSLLSPRYHPDLPVRLATGIALTGEYFDRQGVANGLDESPLDFRWIFVSRIPWDLKCFPVKECINSFVGLDVSLGGFDSDDSDGFAATLSGELSTVAAYLPNTFVPTEEYGIRPIRIFFRDVDAEDDSTLTRRRISTEIFARWAVYSKHARTYFNFEPTIGYLDEENTTSREQDISSWFVKLNISAIWQW